MVDSLINTVFKILDIFRDRPRLKIKAHFGFKMGAGGRGPDMMIVTGTNIGRRPIKLVSAGLRMSQKNGDITRIPDWDEPRLPKKLGEFDDFVTYYDIDGIKAELKKKGADVKIEFGYYRDAADNLHKYKIPHNILKQLHE